MPPTPRLRRRWTRHLLAGALAGGAALRTAGAQFGGNDTTGLGVIRAAGTSVRELSVTDAGPGLAGRTLGAVLARPHLVVVPPDTGLVIGRGVSVDRSLIITRGPVRFAGRVRGDLIVFGDLFLRPGAEVTGRAIAIGGGVYGSTLAFVRGDVLPYQDLAVQQRAVGTGVNVSFGTGAAKPGPFFGLPGLFGFRIPSYDRIDGLSLTFGPELALDTGRVRIEPVVTYRSHLGELDPGVRAHAELGRRSVVEAVVERGTFTNDAWIRGDLVNSLSTIGSGEDVRNYYRGTRATATVARRYDLATGVLTPYVGALTENSESVARDTGSTSYPWSLFSRRSLEASRRANPRVTGGRITSLLAGARYQFERPRVVGSAGARLEQSLDVGRGSQFTQVTLDASLSLPTRDEHLFEMLAHGVATAGGVGVPSQRYTYLGGSGTLPSLFLLEQGGTELAWAEARYTIPVRAVPVPFGVPTLTARAMVGSAGVNTLAGLTPNLGLRAAVSILRVDYVFDPRGRGRRVFTAGVGLR